MQKNYIKLQAKSIEMIQKLILNTQMIWLIFIKLLKDIVQIKHKKMFIIFDEKIGDIPRNRKIDQQ